MLGYPERKTWWIYGCAVVAVVLVSLNVTQELAEDDTTLLEIALDAIETILMVVGAGGVAMLVDRMQAEHKEKLALINNLAVARTEGELWRTRVQSQLAGLSEEIDRQFEAWSLTDAEKEIGMLMLKGLSHKDTAALRGTSEATVRQQARSIYQKSKLPGKAAFSAYFLEDLLPSASLAGANNEALHYERNRAGGNPESDYTMGAAGRGD